MPGWELAVIGAVIGGLGFRLRGWEGFERLTGRGATTARIVCWALPMALLARVAGASWPDAYAIGAGLYLGALAPWWRSLSLGANPADGPPLAQYLRHAARGLLWTLPAAAAHGWSAAVGWWALGGDPLALDVWRPALILAASGLACVPAYQIGAWTGGGTAHGELIFGAVMGAAVVHAAAAS